MATVGRRGATEPNPDLAAMVARVTEIVIAGTIDIPRILVVPRNRAGPGFRPFALDLSKLLYEAPSQALWAAHLASGRTERIAADTVVAPDTRRPRDQLVAALLDFDDVAYAGHQALLQDLADQVVRHLARTLSDEAVRSVIRIHRDEIARGVHAQMQRHVRPEDGAAEDVVVTRGFTALRPSAYTIEAGAAPRDFRLAPPDRSNMARYLFGGFARCLYCVQKFDSDAERRLAIVLDRDALRWFRPARGQFQIFYRVEGSVFEYQPDFLAEMVDRISIIEPKAADRMGDADVAAKRDAALAWCRHAGDHARRHGGKSWTYALIPHDVIAENRTLDGLLRDYAAA